MVKTKSIAVSQLRARRKGKTRRLVSAGGSRKRRSKNRVPSVQHKKQPQVDLQAEYNQGLLNGMQAGLDQGYPQGHLAGLSRFGDRLEGTIIIIPTYNKKEFVFACIDSIRAYTKEPFELIIIDNGSTDGTAEELRRLSGSLRYMINEKNLGFAGAVNQGLMMAKGTTILILNNDTIVTANWLTNLLHCLNSDPSFGIVGPVTNYISGEQLEPAQYSDLPAMHAFAARNNHSNPERWIKTERMTGFCILMHKELLDRLGLFEEGYEVGNFEDDDYGLRIRMLGCQLIIARDSFIHHYGSQSMLALGAAMMEVNDRNSQFYSRKWQDPQAIVSSSRDRVEFAVSQTIHFYPSHVVVKGPSGNCYWIQNGSRHPVPEDSRLEASRVCRFDLRSWPLAEPLSNETVLHRITELAIAANEHGIQSNELHEGMIYQAADGTVYQYYRRCLHRFASEWALKFWQLQQRRIYPLSQANLAAVPEGNPIIAGPVLKAANL